MKKLLVINLILFSCFSCSNEIDIHVNLGYLPAVYCLLDLNSDQQFVRISRTYQSDAENSGKPPSADSLIIREPCEIYIEKWTGDDPVETYLFSKTMLPKDTGFFPVQGQESYVSEFKAEPLTRYVLYVYFPDINKVVSGETLTTSFPVPEDPKPEIPRAITITRDRGYTARWFSVAHGGVYQGIFTLNYMETLDEGTSFHHIQWLLPNVILDEPNELVSQELNPKRFFDMLIQSIQVNPDVERELVGLGFTLIAGGEEVGLSLRTSDINDFTTNSDYTNLDNGIGLFSSLARAYVQNLEFSYLTEDAVCTDPELKLLNFKKAGTHE
ncbi:MAG: hypothetical protein D4R64_05660 [Porphyromonadaceae bacterium]|nr:MAG: hypothetical protein D4R64_05660 [Porphyromonadaceae bacterium]